MHTCCSEDNAKTAPRRSARIAAQRNLRESKSATPVKTSSASNNKNATKNLENDLVSAPTLRDLFNIAVTLQIEQMGRSQERQRRAERDCCQALAILGAGMLAAGATWYLKS
jgi:hypothetical protein